MTEPLANALTVFLATRGITAAEIESVEVVCQDYGTYGTLYINYRDTEGAFRWLELAADEDIAALLTSLVVFRG